MSIQNGIAQNAQKRGGNAFQFLSRFRRQPESSDPSISKAAEEVRAVQPALWEAYDKLAYYDAAAMGQKTAYMTIRTLVLWLAMIASALSIILGIVTVDDSRRFALRVVLALIVIAVARLMVWSHGIPTAVWVEYRRSAELLRRESYLYRFGAGEDYKGKTLVEQQVMLIKKVREADTGISMPLTMLTRVHMNKRDLDARIASQLVALKWDFPYKQATIDDYIESRLVGQHDWYARRVRQEFGRKRRNEFEVMVIGAIMALLPLLGAEAMVAMAAAFSTMVVSIGNLNMYGRTYGLYEQAARKLRELREDWDITPPANRNSAELIKQVEKVFEDEINQWVMVVKNTLDENERDIDTATRGLPGAGELSPKPKDNESIGDKKPSPKNNIEVQLSTSSKVEVEIPIIAAPATEGQGQLEATKITEPGGDAMAIDAIVMPDPASDTGS